MNQGYVLNWLVPFYRAHSTHSDENNLCEMLKVVSIDAKYLRDEKYIPYKYVVYSPKTNHNHIDQCYEYLHHCDHLANRCLRMLKGDFSDCYGGLALYIHLAFGIMEFRCTFSHTGSYHQYDTICYPERQSETKSLLGAVTSYVWTSKKERALLPLSMKEICKLCLHHYLMKFKQPNLDVPHEIAKAVSDMKYIYQSMWGPLTIASKPGTPTVNKQTYIAEVSAQFVRFEPIGVRNFFEALTGQTF